MKELVSLTLAFFLLLMFTYYNRQVEVIEPRDWILIDKKVHDINGVFIYSSSSTTSIEIFKPTQARRYISKVYYKDSAGYRSFVAKDNMLQLLKKNLELSALRLLGVPSRAGLKELGLLNSSRLSIVINTSIDSYEFDLGQKIFDGAYYVLRQKGREQVFAVSAQVVDIFIKKPESLLEEKLLGNVTLSSVEYIVFNVQRNNETNEQLRLTASELVSFWPLLNKSCVSNSLSSDSLWSRSVHIMSVAVFSKNKKMMDEVRLGYVYLDGRKEYLAFSPFYDRWTIVSCECAEDLFNKVLSMSTGYVSAGFVD